VLVHNAALLRFTDVGVDAAANSDGGDQTRPGANLRLNSTNAALVIENSYWVRSGSHSCFRFDPTGLPSPYHVICALARGLTVRC
jgi:hypothetical protein